MAESASNSEIEDVLSSIRRLVSQDIRRGDGSTAMAEPEKLVLTPALRVEAQDEAVDLDDDGSETDVSALDAGWSGAPAGADDEFEFDDDTDEPPFDWDDDTHVAEVQESVYDEPEIAAPEAEAAQAEPSFPRQSALQAKIAELEALIGDRQEDWEPDAGADDVAESVEAMEWDDQGPSEAQVDAPDWDEVEAQVDEPEWDQAEAAWDGETEADEDAAEAFAEDVAEYVIEDAVELPPEEEAQEAEAATVAPDHGDAWDVDPLAPPAEAAVPQSEPMDAPAAVDASDEAEGRDEALAEEAQASTPHVAGFARTEQRLHLSDGSAARDDEDDDIDLFAEDNLLDEETLREMVADIVRQELQGALGERITRNVRKLVRREIHRALNSQDFD
ncbi:hypothetical protein [Mesobacterium pallidum]|uniref:hypothetical protein n=1 Tax=Mesobacterium pallidum TaxID=2872037 RepID=UPI001EE17476|nr:hypothetical protein [Mesobacterium pallidum]